MLYCPRTAHYRIIAQNGVSLIMLVIPRNYRFARLSYLYLILYFDLTASRSLV